jgi:hypothetical protein
VNTSEDLDELAKRLSYLAVKHQYSEFESIMQTIFDQEAKLRILVELANRLSGAFQSLCLCGLPYLIKLTEDDYIELYRLAHEKNIAVYNLTRFLLVHGRATRSVFQKMCQYFDEIERIEQFKFRLDGGSLPDEARVNERQYNYLKTPLEYILPFRKKIATMA